MWGGGSFIYVFISTEVGNQG
jgi:hypothetical protein